jgi:hypothetical protein
MDVSDQVHAPAALPKLKMPRYPMNRMLCESYSRAASFIEAKHFLPVLEIDPRNLGYPARSFSALATSSWFPCHSKSAYKYF